MSFEMKSRGRQKIEIKKITNESYLQVTFSKRRNGLFKKSSELCTLCGVEMALIVFSPSQKVFSFGHPSVEAVIERYLSQALPQPFESVQHAEAQCNANVRELDAQLSQIKNQLDAERKHENELNRLRKEIQTQISWPCIMEDMDMSHLEHFKVALDEIKKKVSCYCDKILNDGVSVAGAASTTPKVHQSFVVGPSDGMIPLHHPPPQPQPPQVFPPEFFRGPMTHGAHLFGGFNMGGNGGPPHGSN